MLLPRGSIVQNEANFRKPDGRTQGSAVQTKPIRGDAARDGARAGGRGVLYKQSQFRRRVRRGKCFLGKELWWCGHATHLGETNPIPARTAMVGVGIAASAAGGAIAPNKANLHPRERIGGASPTLQVDSIAPNKPNSACLSLGGDLCETNPIWPAASGPRKTKCAKRTQFGEVDRWAEYPAFDYSSAGCRCHKQVRRPHAAARSPAPARLVGWRGGNYNARRTDI